jgi:hypothetical protein
MTNGCPNSGSDSANVFSFTITLSPNPVVSWLHCNSKLHVGDGLSRLWTSQLGAIFNKYDCEVKRPDSEP